MKIKKLSENAFMPVRSFKGDSGADLRCPVDFTVNPGRQIIPMNIAIELPRGKEATVRPRSGFSAKGMEGYKVSDINMETPLRFDADVLIGTVDETYRGNVGVIVKSFETEPFILKRGTRIAQMVVSDVDNRMEFELSDELSDTERSLGGFGHTGTNELVKS